MFFFRAYSQFEDFYITQSSGTVATKRLSSPYSDMRIDRNDRFDLLPIFKILTLQLA